MINNIVLVSGVEQIGSVTHAHVCSAMSDSFATPWTVASQAPLSIEFSSQEYWSRLLFPSPSYTCICSYSFEKEFVFLFFN